MSETVLQFGAGRFLRGFVDRFIANLNQQSIPVGKVVVVQSTPGKRAELLNQCCDGYPVVVCGIEKGAVVERVETVDCISRALTATEQWSDVLALATSDDLKFVVSNATEAGYVLSRTKDGPPESLPGKLTAVLHERFKADKEPLTILPCELIPQNADKLLDLVIQQGDAWDLGKAFAHYASDHCRWMNNLVDCIVSDLPNDDPRLKDHPLAIMAEPYALLAIEQDDRHYISPENFPLANHAAVELVSNLEPYYLRKVRVLNGVHTAMVAKYLGSSLDTVQRILADDAGQRWARDLLYGEILPTLIGRVEGAVQFVDDTLDRFTNPFLSHRLSDIRLNHEQKVPVRLVPTADDYEHRFGCRPPLLQAAIDTVLQ